ncbi:MAG: alcohol dehydrogenase family protein [Pseudomonadales bacterium]
MTEQIPETMQAMVLTGHGGMDMLVFEEEWPTPKLGPSDVLIEVRACGLNNTDVNTRSGWYSKTVTDGTTGDGFDEVNEEDPTWGAAPLSFPRIQGADVCGVAVACGENADQSLLGKRVITDNWLRDWSDPLNLHGVGYFGSECDGGYAQYTVIDHRNVGAVDCDLDDEELATFSCSYTTAEGMLSRANVVEGDRVLITGASGGVGSALIQLAKRRGAVVIAMASEAKHAQVSELSPDVILPRAPEALDAALKEATGYDTVNVVADVVGGDYFPTLIEAMERGGRYTCSGAIAGPMVSLDLRTLYLNDLRFIGSTIVEPHVFTDLISYIERGEIKPILAKKYPLRDFHRAQQAFIDKKHVGNIVVCP